MTRRPGLVVAALVAVSTLVRFAAARAIHTPWITPDEVIYGELGRSLYASGRFEVLHEHIGFFGLVFPALVGAPLSADDLERAYHWLKLVQALVMSLTAVPVYLWARSLASPRWALSAAALTVAIPGLAYSGLIMSEVAFYPALVLAAWTIARELDVPSPLRQALVVGACALAAMTRLQAFVLLPVYLTAVAAKAALDRRPRDAVRHAPTALALGALAAAWAVWRLAANGSAGAVLGAYSPAAETHYGVSDALEYTLYHAGDLVLLAGVVPVLATLALIRSRRERGPLTAFYATAVSLAVWLVAEVGVFASRHVGLLAERNLLPLAPVLFVGFAAWLERGAPRPRALVPAVALLVVALPVRRFAVPEAFPDAFTLEPVIELARRYPHANVDLLVVVAVTLLALATALVPRRFAWILPAVLCFGFAGISVAATREIVARDRDVQRSSTGPDRRWIDRHADGAAGYVFIGDLNWPAVWQNVFWNRRIAHVYDLGAVSVPGGMPQTRVDPAPDGRLPGIVEPYVATLYPLALVGRAVAATPSGLVLWRAEQPVRVDTWTQRAAGRMHLIVYDCRGGRLRVKLRGPAGAVVRLSRNRSDLREVRLGASGTRTVVLAADPVDPGGLCTFDIVADPSVTVPVAEFRRAPG